LHILIDKTESGKNKHYTYIRFNFLSWCQGEIDLDVQPWTGVELVDRILFNYLLFFFFFFFFFFFSGRSYRFRDRVAPVKCTSTRHIITNGTVATYVSRGPRAPPDTDRAPRGNRRPRCLSRKWHHTHPGGSSKCCPKQNKNRKLKEHPQVVVIRLLATAYKGREGHDQVW
jgi:hypothetical protein